MVVVSFLTNLFLMMFVSFFDFVYQEIIKLHADTSMKIAMNTNDIPTIPVKFRLSKTMCPTFHLYVNYLTGIFKKDLPNLVITETIGKSWNNKTIRTI